MESLNESYLGDGLYVSYDGWQICLRASRWDGDHVVHHSVYLQQDVYNNLLEYVRRLDASAQA